MPLNDTSRNAAVTAIATGITHIGAHTLTDPGTGANANSGEASGGSYARQAVAWAAAGSGQDANSGELAIPVPAGEYGFLTFYNALTGNTNNYRGYAPMGGENARKGFFSTDTTLTNDQLLSVAHGLVDGNRVMLFNVFAETLPTGTTEGTIYHVVGSATNTFQVSTSAGGSAVDITALGGGEGFWQQVVPETYNAPGEITVPVGTLILDATTV